MQSISSQMFSNSSLASNESYGVVMGGIGNSIEQGIINNIPSDTNTLGCVKMGNGFSLDSDNKLKDNGFELIETFTSGYEITTEEPNEGWYNGETLIEQDLFEEGFIPVSDTFYKHTGTNHFLYVMNGIYYFNGTKYVAYYKDTGTLGFPIYSIVTQQETWEPEKFYSFEKEIPLFVQPSDWTTNWKAYYSRIGSSKICMQPLTSSSAPEFVANTYYQFPTSLFTNFTRTKEPDGIGYNLKSLLLYYFVRIPFINWISMGINGGHGFNGWATNYCTGADWTIHGLNNYFLAENIGNLILTSYWQMYSGCTQNNKWGNICFSDKITSLRLIETNVIPPYTEFKIYAIRN